MTFSIIQYQCYKYKQDMTIFTEKYSLPIVEYRFRLKSKYNEHIH